MSKSQSLKRILTQAREKEKTYYWVEAAELFEQALRAVGKRDFLRKGEIQERIGHCFHRLAMQAGSQEEFTERMRRAVGAYERAHGFYERLTDDQKTARMFRCNAVVKYLDFWLTSTPSRKRKLLDECLDLEGKALAGFSESGDMLEYGRTYDELSLVFYFRVELEWDIQTLKSVVERGLEWGEKAVTALLQLGDPYELARANLTLATCLIFLERYVAEPEEIDKNRLKIVKCLGKTIELSEKIGDAYLFGLSHLWLAEKTEDEESIRHSEKALQCGERTRDNFLIAGGLNYLAYLTRWKTIATEDPDQRKKLEEKVMQFLDKGQHHYSIISLSIPRCSTIGVGRAGALSGHYIFLAMWETNLKKRIEFLEKSEKYGVEALKSARDSDVPSVVAVALNMASKTLEMRANVEPDPTEKRSRLVKALKHQEESIEIFEKLAPIGDKYVNLGLLLHRLAQIEAGLANVEPDLNDKRKLLEEAVLIKEKSLKLIDKVMPYYERLCNITFFSRLHSLQDTYATLLLCLHDLTSKPEHLRKVIEILEKAVESANKADMVSLIAESYWKIGKTQDILEEHLKAAHNFKRASENYMKATKKIPQLKDLYQDYASYMEAWGEIEKARHHHRRQEYGSAKEHFEKAANLHKSSRQWGYLAPNYSAWAQIEHAEEVSRKEQSEEASQIFKQAAQLFKETQKSLQTQRSKIESLDEKQMVTSMLKSTDLRYQFCVARIALEEARILDKKGDHYLSSEKYGSASETFSKISQKLESKQDLKEFKFLISISQAWQKMTLAEAEASPALYREASKHFEEARESSPNEKAKMLMLGHSRFCKALETGTRFEDTRDTTLHSTTTRHLESASNYYLKAGFKNASEYARATHRLFDAYMYVHKAETETDPRKKAQYYQMAEKLLQASAGSYMKAKHPEKSEEVGRLLENVKEERQLATSLIEVLHAPAITSATTSFSTPTPTHEQAVGLERFEHADIQANLILRVREVKVGEYLSLIIALVNAGKAPALLIKIENLIPEGFELTEEPEAYRIEDHYLNMKGKRLDPLKTEDVKLVLKPLSKGTFILKPGIMYLDETGKYKSLEPEPVAITVKELGIKGWIKGGK